MKKEITLLLGLLLAIPATWSNSTRIINCRTHFEKIGINLSLNQKVEADLLQGVWKKVDKDGTYATYQFDVNSKVHVLAAFADGAQSYSRLNWQVLIEEGSPLLAIGKGGEMKIFTLTPTCLGLEMMDRSSGEVIELTLEPAISKREMESIRQALAGKWENTMYPFEVLTASANGNEGEYIPGAFLKYEFRLDGTYTKTLGSARVKISENGRWELSSDGKTVFFHADDNSPKTTVAARLKHLQLDELVLEHALQCKDRSFSTGLKDFFFNKQ
jgi:hypothetical protein